MSRPSHLHLHLRKSENPAAFAKQCQLPNPHGPAFEAAFLGQAEEVQVWANFQFRSFTWQLYAADRRLIASKVVFKAKDFS